MSEGNSRQKNIVITGFMGTGKTEVGQIVAKLLNREFMDTDEIIQKRSGKSIPQIFAQSGEVYFRLMESELVEELSSKSDLIIATGGGTLLNSGNFRLLHKSSHIFCLTARPEIIQKRLAGVKDRPLLGRSPSIDGIKILLEERKSKYDKIHIQIDTSETSVKRTAEIIIDISNGMAE